MPTSRSWTRHVESESILVGRLYVSACQLRPLCSGERERPGRHLSSVSQAFRQHACSLASGGLVVGQHGQQSITLQRLRVEFRSPPSERTRLSSRLHLDGLGLNPYRNQIEVITSEQMLDAYAATGMPLMYSHWSFGKQFAREELLYRKGASLWLMSWSSIRILAFRT